MRTLKEIEQELSGCVKADQRTWARIYRLMDEVERRQLYRQRPGTPSFTRWLNTLAEEIGVHVSLLWARKKAGKNYEEYKERAEQQGRAVPELEDLSVSPDSLNLCEKVAGKNATEMDRLIDRVIAGDLTREDLRAAAKARKDVAKSRHDRIEAKDRTGNDARVTASDIVLALHKADWLTATRDDYFEHIYKCFPEFRVNTGTTRHSRQIDALIVETLTAVERDEVVLRGIEIKVDVNDLVRDQKMAEYTDFCDFFYLAIPADEERLIAAAEASIQPDWGLLTVGKDGKICVLRDAEKMKALFRDKALSTCLIKTLPHV